MSRLTVTSEIYAETDFKCCDLSETSKKQYWLNQKVILIFDLKLFTESVSTFTFHYPIESGSISCREDVDGDLDVQRRKRGEIKIGKFDNDVSEKIISILTT